MNKLSDSCETDLNPGPTVSRLRTLRIRIKKRKSYACNVATSASIPRSLPEEEEIVDACWTKIAIEKWSPSTSQQATLTAISFSLYLIGGISRTINQDIYVFNSQSKDWNKVLTGSQMEPRFGHTAVAYQNSLLVFGGGTFFNTAHRLRECLNGVRKLSVPSHQITYLKTSGTFIPARKGHVSGVLGKHMIISGGMNDKQHIIGDCAVLNLQKLTWSYLEITNIHLLARAYHSASSVVSGPSSQSVYRLADPGYVRPGLFVFGGLDYLKRPSNTLINIAPGSKPVKCEVVAAGGVPPSPRFMHSMVFCKSFNLLVVFGGRIDLNDKKEYTCFSDVHIFNVTSLFWTTVRVHGNVPTARSAHCSEIIGQDMLIFGGVRNSFYCSSEVFKLSIHDDGKSLKDSTRRRKSTTDRF